MTQVLYRKWRPQAWEEVIGQDHIIQTLRNSIVAGRIAHAYLFAGPRGTGKTTTARLLAKAVNCLAEDLALRPCGTCDHCKAIAKGHFLDMIEIDAASNTGVDDVRDLRDKINFSPNQGRYKVYIIDEVHMLSKQAFNALLKTLEEPPPHAIFVLATTEVHKIPATVLSRCQRHEFRRIPVAEIVQNLETITEEENIQVEPEALRLIARQATGSMRDAISLLDQLASSEENITLEIAHTVLGTATNQAVIDVVDSLVQRQAGQGLDHIHRTLDGGSDPRQFARQIVDYLRYLLWIRLGNADQVDATDEVRSQMDTHAQAFKTTILLDVIRAFNYAATDAKSDWLPALPLEMAFVDSLEIIQKMQSNPTTGSLTTGATPSSSKDHSEKLHSVQTEGTHDATIPYQSGNIDKNPQDQQATQNLTQLWPRILSTVRQKNSKAHGLLNSSKSHFIRGDELVLSFASEPLKKMMEDTGILQAVQQAIIDVTKQDLRIVCVVDATKRNEIPAGVNNDGMIAAAVRDLGGEIVDIQ